MAKLKRYTDLFTHRRQSVLPEYAQKAINNLGHIEVPCFGEVGEIEAYRAALDTLDPKLITQAGPQIRDIGGIHGWRETGYLRSIFFGRLLRQPDGYGWFSQFHGDGFKREAAMNQLDGPPRSPFEFVSIVYRMNDWVPEVRAAALKYAENYFPRADCDVVGKAALFLLMHMQKLARWDARAVKCVEDTLYREDVGTFIKNQLLTQSEGGAARVLRSLAKRADFDPFIPELSANAKSASVRACATDFLLNGRAQWSSGYKRVWVNKALGVSRLIPDLRQRPLSISIQIPEIMDRASKDRSAHVRIIVASALIRQLVNPLEWHTKIAVRLKCDKNQSVASRMDFYFRAMAAGGA